MNKNLLSAVFFLIAIALPVSAQENVKEVPDVEALFFPNIPPVKTEIKGTDLYALSLVSTPNAEAAKYTSVGYSYLHAGWDFEAYRYFCQALRSDENCLMAHVGVALSLTSPFHHEMLTQRKAAVLRLLELVELKRDGEFHFPKNERGFAAAVAFLIVEGREAGVRAFSQLVDEYPKDSQIPFMHAVFQREGYDVLGKPRQGEEKALARVKELYRERPTSSIAAQYFLVMHLDASIAPEVLSKTVLPVARKLARPGGVATWYHWLGVFEYRCGNLKEAEEAFERAVELLAQWKSAEGISNEDADALWKAKIFLATVLVESGKLAEAEKIADEFVKLRIDEKRLWAAGTQLILWDGWSLGVRMHLRPDFSSIQKAIDYLPEGKKLAPYKGRSAAYFCYDFLGNYLAVIKANKVGKIKEAGELALQLGGKLTDLDEVKQTGLITGEAYGVVRFMKWARQVTAQARSLNDGETTMKVVELRQSAEESSLPRRMLPPMNFYAYEEELVPLLIKQKKFESAELVIRKALDRRPSLKALWQLASELGKRTNNVLLKKEADEKLRSINGG